MAVNVYPGANTVETISPLLKEAYPKPEKSEAKKKKKRFSKLAKLIKFNK